MSFFSKNDIWRTGTQLTLTPSLNTICVWLNLSCDKLCVLRLAAIALLVLQSEEDAFWCLVAVVETIMPQDYYTKNLVASQVRRYSR